VAVLPARACKVVASLVRLAVVRRGASVPACCRLRVPGRPDRFAAARNWWGKCGPRGVSFISEREGPRPVSRQEVPWLLVRKATSADGEGEAAARREPAVGAVAEVASRPQVRQVVGEGPRHSGRTSCW
jgi:hypothetical protein